MSTRTRSIPQIARLASLGVVLFAAVFTWYHAVDLPHVDDWSHLVIVAAFHDGLSPIHALWAPHNEHRALVPRALIVGLALLSDWDLRVQMFATQIFIVATLIILARALRQVQAAPPEILPLVAALLFSMHGWMNWLWGCQVHVGMVVFLAIASLMLLGQPRVAVGRVVAAALLAIAASWSFVSGFAVWPAGLLLLTVRPFPLGGRATALVIWSAGAGIAFGFHFAGPDPAPAPAAGELDVGRLAEFVARYFGSAILGSTPEGYSLIPIGAIAVAALTAGGVLVVVRHRARPLLLALVPGLGLFALANAVMIAVGRTRFGVELAASSRYATLAGIGWIAVVVAVPVLASGLRGWKRAAALVAIILFAATLITTQAASIRAAAAFSKRQATARTALREGEGITWEVLESAFGDPASKVHGLSRRLDILRERRLSLFRDSPMVSPAPTILSCLPKSAAPDQESVRVIVEVSGGVPRNVVVVYANSAGSEMLTTISALGSTGDTQVAIYVPKAGARDGMTIQAISIDRHGRVIPSAPVTWQYQD